MSCDRCGLNKDVCLEWGCPRLVTTRDIYEDCTCLNCEGHYVETVPLQVWEWYWKPSQYDMAKLIPILEDSKTRLIGIASRLGEEADHG
jgi:hypothetical protein